MKTKILLVVVTVVLATVPLFAAYAATTPMPKPGPLAQVIEGAKREGTVTMFLHTAWTDKGVDRLGRELKEKFGVDLDIKFTTAARGGRSGNSGYYGASGGNNPVL